MKELENLNFDYNADQIDKLINEYIKDMKEINRKIKEEDLKPEEIYNLYVYGLDKYDYKITSALFLENVSSDIKIRNKCMEMNEKLSEIYSEELKDDRLYEKVKIMKKMKDYKKDKVLKKYIDEIILSFEYNGVHLNKKKREIFEKLKKEGIKKELQFSKNIRDDNTKIIIPKNKKMNLSDLFIKKHFKNNKIIVTLSHPDISAVMKDVVNENIRKEMYIKKERLGGYKNVELLRDILKIRNKMSKILFGMNYIQLKFKKDRIATYKKVKWMMNKCKPYIINRQKEDIKKLKIFKKEKFGDDNINVYDTTFINNLYIKDKYDLDTNKLREYFPFPHVFKEVLKFYGKLFGIKFEKIEKISKNLIWIKDVVLYKVLDQKTNRLEGYIYFDMYPRDGKYNHASTNTIQETYLDMNNKRIIPICVILCNFDKPIGKIPSLLSHGEITTLCHELGHALHVVLSNVKYSLFSGTNTEIDFVESVSQMMEEFCYEKDFIKKMSQHYKTKKEIPDDYIKKIQELKNHNKGIEYSRQLLYILYDLKIHENKNYDVKKLIKIWNDIDKQLYENRISNKNIKKKLYPMSSFEHLMGYDVAYYSYIWSEIYSYIFYRKIKENKKKNGIKFRREILEKGGSKKGKDLIKGFLGRKDNLNDLKLFLYGFK